MKDLLLINKQVGETPLQCIERFRAAYSEYEGIKMTYAGRLDPMAEGLLLVLAGNRVHEKELFLKLPKTYECTAIIGVGTDTYDVLGMPDTPSAGLSAERLPLQEGDIVCLESFIGTFKQPYPPYSSKTVQGKQLHAHAREGTIADIEIPFQEVTVTDITLLHRKDVLVTDVVDDIISRIGRVTGDFRQEAIIAEWKRLAEENPGKTLELVTFSINVSGGTYIRGIVDAWGKKMGKKACILRLKRTTVGPYRLLDTGI